MTVQFKRTKLKVILYPHCPFLLSSIDAAPRESGRLVYSRRRWNRKTSSFFARGESTVSNEPRLGEQEWRVDSRVVDDGAIEALGS